MKKRKIFSLILSVCILTSTPMTSFTYGRLTDEQRAALELNEKKLIEKNKEEEKKVEVIGIKNEKGITISPKEQVPEGYNSYVKELNRIRNYTGKVNINVYFKKYKNNKEISKIKLFGDGIIKEGRSSGIFGKICDFSKYFITSMDLTNIGLQSTKLIELLNSDIENQKDFIEKNFVQKESITKITFTKKQLSKEIQDELLNLFIPEMKENIQSINSLSTEFKVSTKYDVLNFEIELINKDGLKHICTYTYTYNFRA